MLWGLCGDSLPTGKWIAIKKHQQALRLTSQPKHTPLRLAQVGNCLRKTRQRLVAKPQLTLEQCKMAKLRTMHQQTTFWQCSQQAQTFNKSIAQNSTISKSFGVQVAKHTVLQQKKRLEQSNRFVLRSTLR